MHLRVKLLLIAWTIALILIFTFVGKSLAQPHSHEGAAGRFYEKWMMPDKRTVSCCSKKDCYTTEAKQVGDHWFARIRETGQFVRVPPEKIEVELDNPDGQNHVCASQVGHVYCFIVGAGG